jgi:hypothetical protein
MDEEPERATPVAFNAGKSPITVDPNSILLQSDPADIASAIIAVKSRMRQSSVDSNQSTSFRPSIAPVNKEFNPVSPSEGRQNGVHSSPLTSNGEVPGSMNGGEPSIPPQAQISVIQNGPNEIIIPKAEMDRSTFSPKRKGSISSLKNASNSLKSPLKGKGATSTIPLPGPPPIGGALKSSTAGGELFDNGTDSEESVFRHLNHAISPHAVPLPFSPEAMLAPKTSLSVGMPSPLNGHLEPPSQEQAAPMSPLDQISNDLKMLDNSLESMKSPFISSPAANSSPFSKSIEPEPLPLGAVSDVVSTLNVNESSTEELNVEEKQDSFSSPEVLHNGQTDTDVVEVTQTTADEESTRNGHTESPQAKLHQSKSPADQKKVISDLNSSASPTISKPLPAASEGKMNLIPPPIPKVSDRDLNSSESSPQTVSPMRSINPEKEEPDVQSDVVEPLRSESIKVIDPVKQTQRNPVDTPMPDAEQLPTEKVNFRSTAQAVEEKASEDATAVVKEATGNESFTISTAPEVVQGSSNVRNHASKFEPLPSPPQEPVTSSQPSIPAIPGSNSSESGKEFASCDTCEEKSANSIL